MEVRKRKMEKSRKAQIRMSETIAILFIFFVLVLFGLIFYFKFQQVSLKEKQQELLAARAMDATLRTIFLPEVQCSNAEAEPEDNCLDVLKLRHAGEIIQVHASEYYFQLFSFADITVYQLYPFSVNYTLYHREKTRELENGTIIPDWERKEPTFFVVSLRDETAGGHSPSYGYGYVAVEAYS